MSEDLYERYKEALKRGHVAAMHGRSDAALAAYVEAATIAPERALPHASIGTVCLRAGRIREALAAFDAALARAARDETALAGRADALEALDRPADAAAALDDLTAIQDAAGRLTDACDTARRALALAESRPRRRTVEALAARLREAEAGGPESEALARALRLLDATAVAERSSAPDGVSEPEPELAPEPPPPPTLAELLEITDRAEAAVAAGDAAAARRLYLEVADAHARAGRPDAALDACGAAIAVGPADPELHLALVRLYLDRGWDGLASEKLALLDRLADLAGDEATRERVRELVATGVAADAPGAAVLDGASGAGSGAERGTDPAAATDGPPEGALAEQAEPNSAATGDEAVGPR